MTEATTNEVQQTLAEYERAAISTGEWDGTEVDFSHDGVTWVAYLAPSEEHPHPPLARATVHRKGVKVPTVVVVPWDEAVPADSDWAGLWDAKPHLLFGAFAARSALRRAFRDVIGDRREPDETQALSVSTSGVAPLRDWEAELMACTTVDQVNALWADIRAARAMTVPLEFACREKRIALGIADPSTVRKPTLFVKNLTEQEASEIEEEGALEKVVSALQQSTPSLSAASSVVSPAVVAQIVAAKKTQAAHS